MAEVGVNIEVNVDIDVDDFLEGCANYELDEVIDWLRESYTSQYGLNHEDLVKTLLKISNSTLQLTTEEEEYIKSLANRLV
jgi:hypothetical protein